MDLLGKRQIHDQDGEGQTNKEQAVTRLLAQLTAMDHKELKHRWREQFGRETPER
jgi:hypothetical protein